MNSPESEPLVSFGMVADVQYAEIEPKGDRHFSGSLAKLQSAVADLASEDLAFTIQAGDLIEKGIESFAPALESLSALSHPVHHLLGNHDFSVDDDEKGQVDGLLGLQRGYRGFSHGGVRFLLLDTTEISAYRYPPESPVGKAAVDLMKRLEESGENHARPWNGGVSRTQLDWLRRQLGASDDAREPVIVCGHHPLLPEEGHQAWNNREILDVLDGHPCVRGYLCGHHHDGGEVILNGVPYITFRSLLHRPDVTAYAVVRLYHDRLVIEGRDREPSREIPLSAL